MKKLLLLALPLMMIGCETKTEEERFQEYLVKKKAEEAEAIKFKRWHGFEVKVIDGCEYIIRADTKGDGYRGFGFGFMSHKGNCRFCAERRKQEIKELIEEIRK